MKGSKTLTAVGLLAAINLATLGLVEAGGDRVRCRVRDGRAQIDVDARANRNITHSVAITEESPDSSTQTFDGVPAPLGELDFRGDTVAGQDPYVLNTGFGNASGISVKIDGAPLVINGQSVFACTR
jgi:hypothetical protein